MCSQPPGSAALFTCWTAWARGVDIAAVVGDQIVSVKQQLCQGLPGFQVLLWRPETPFVFLGLTMTGLRPPCHSLNRQCPKGAE